MKNIEKYTNEIKDTIGNRYCDFVKEKVLKKESCNDVGCSQCAVLTMIWVNEEYEEPEVDWSQVAVDTPVLVRNNADEEWKKRHFAEYEYGFVYTWCDGRTSWSEGETVTWEEAKLAEGVKA